MKELIKYQLLTAFLLMLSFTNVLSQIDISDTIKQDQTVVVKMDNGDEFKGTIIERNDEFITLRTTNGEIKLVVSNVKSIENYTYSGKFAFPNANSTRYFFAPSAIPLEKKHGYYQNVYVLFNSVHYGITKNISIGGGLEFFSTFAGHPIWNVTAKAGFNLSENHHIGGGIIYAGLSDEGSGGIAYGMYTLGNSDKSLSLGGGLAFSTDTLLKRPVFAISGTIRVSSGFAFLSENYLIFSDDQLFFAGIEGIRLITRRSSFDIGLVAIPELITLGAGIPFLPFVGYVFNF